MTTIDIRIELLRKLERSKREVYAGIPAARRAVGKERKALRDALAALNRYELAVTESVRAYTAHLRRSR